MLYGIRTGVCFILIFMLVKSYAEIRSQEVAFCRDCPTVWSSYPIEHGNESFLRFGYWEHSYRIVKTGTVNGQGTFTYANGNKYVGEWKAGEYHGQGTLTLQTDASIVQAKSVIPNSFFDGVKEQERIDKVNKRRDSILDRLVKDEVIKPSFDCKKASTNIEQQICSAPELIKLDRDLGSIYSFLRKEKVADVVNFHGDKVGTKRLFDDQILVLKKMQKRWFKERNECDNSKNMVKCLTNSYKDRIDDLIRIYAEGYDLDVIVVKDSKVNRSYSHTLELLKGSDRKWVLSPENWSHNKVAVENYGKKIGVVYWFECSPSDFVKGEECYNLVVDSVLMETSIGKTHLLN